MTQEKTDKNARRAIIVLSILVFVFFLLWIGSLIAFSQNDSDWYTQYRENHLEWCEFANDHQDIINSLLDELEYYDSEYSEVERFPGLDCFG